MDTNLAGQRLGVAPYTIKELVHDGQGWVATVKDMANHTLTTRRVPGGAAIAAEPGLELDVPTEDATTVEAPAKPAKARKSAGRKAGG